jgi:hypothetical protein
MVVRQVVRAAFGSHGSNELSFDLNGFDCGFDEAGSLKCGADGLRAVSELQPAEHASNRSGVSRKKFSRLTRVISTFVRRRKTLSRCLTIATPPNPPPSTTMRILSRESAATPPSSAETPTTPQ